MISGIAGLLIGYAGILRLILSSRVVKLSSLDLPAGFPTVNGLSVIWGFLFLIWAVGQYFVYTIKLSPRRARNIFLNSLMLVIGIFIWHYMIFGAVNPAGALAVSAAILLLGVVVWFMYLVTHRYGGYLFTSMVIWLIFLLYLSISLTVKN